MPSFPRRVRPTERPSDRKTARPRGRPAAFTLIEVMVATAVMVIMVLMVGSVFQQTSSSWDAGYARAEGGMAVRTVVGSLTRDLATAVDGRRFDLSSPVECNGSSLTFYRLNEDSGGGFEKVVYSLKENSATRNGKQLISINKKNDNDNDKPPFTANFEFFMPEYGVGVDPDPEDETVPIRPFETGAFSGSGGGGGKAVVWTVPYVIVRCSLSRNGSLSGLAVRSLGHDGVPNGTGDRGDDIIVR